MDSPAQAAGICGIAEKIMSAGSSSSEDKAKAMQWIGDAAAHSIGLLSTDNPVIK
jgi:hypothetical protein